MTLPRSVPRLTWLVVALAAGCAGRQNTGAGTPAPPVHLEMDPIKIEATRSGDGVEITSFDAEDLFEQAGAALSDKRFDDAVRLYDKLLASFPDSPYARPGLYNRGLAYRDKKDWNAAVESFKALAEKYATHADAKDAMFQLGACYAELTNWPSSGEVFVRLLERQDLTADDRIEAIARRGFAQFNLADLEAAEKTFRSALAFKQKIEGVERLGTDFYLAFSQYHLGQINHQRFRSVVLRLPEARMESDLEQKASLLLQAQRAYIDTIKYGNPAWASAAGFQVGSLYEELYDAFMNAPVPSNLNGEARTVYVDELHKKIRILLEKSLRWYRENLLMVERLGVNTDWAEKSKLAYSKLIKLLDPNGKLGPAPGPQAPPPAGAPPSPPIPTAPPPNPAPAGDNPNDEATPKRRIL